MSTMCFFRIQLRHGTFISQTCCLCFREGIWRLGCHHLNCSGTNQSPSPEPPSTVCQGQCAWNRWKSLFRQPTVNQSASVEAEPGLTKHPEKFPFLMSGTCWWCDWGRSQQVGWGQQRRASWLQKGKVWLTTSSLTAFLTRKESH